LLPLSGIVFVVLGIAGPVGIGGSTPGSSDSPAVNPSLGVMLVGAAGSILCANWGRRWLGWSAAVLGIALFIPFVDFFGLVLSLVWIIAAAIMLSRERGDATAVRAP
jgi:hypothetical protein